MMRMRLDEASRSDLMSNIWDLRVAAATSKSTSVYDCISTLLDMRVQNGFKYPIAISRDFEVSFFSSFRTFRN